MTIQTKTAQFSEVAIGQHFQFDASGQWHIKYGAQLSARSTGKGNIKVETKNNPIVLIKDVPDNIYLKGEFMSLAYAA